MYRKVLVPLDGSLESEGVLSAIREDISSDTEVVLLKVIPRARIVAIGDRAMFAYQREEAERSQALLYLNDVMRRLGGEDSKWRRETTIAGSVADGIVGFARGDGVDLIALYTHDRKGLARLIRGSVARDVQRRVPIEVKVFKPMELAGVI